MKGGTAAGLQKREFCSFAGSPFFFREDQMRIIISPAKKMKTEQELFSGCRRPRFLLEADQLKRWMQEKTPEELQRLWSCSDGIARQNVERLSGMKLGENLTPALLAYEGIQYQYMAPLVFEEESWKYVQEHLRILSGFYGILMPLDGVVPYRLEMQAKVQIDGKSSLYEFWGDKICRSLERETDVILNLASEEYARAVRPWLSEHTRFLTCAFKEEQGGRLIQKGTYAKMARGELVRLMAERQVEDLAEICGLTPGGYRFCPEKSTENEWIFLKEKEIRR